MSSLRLTHRVEKKRAIKPAIVCREPTETNGEPMSTLRFLSDNVASARADVVFVHGLRGWGGGPETDWKSRPHDPDSFWPQWLQDDVDGIRVGLLSYPAEASAWRGHAMGLEDRARNVIPMLREQGIGDRPLLFITHSLGGLVVKETLLAARHDRDESLLTDSCVGVVFIATPHTGSAVADLARTLPLLRASPAVRALRRANEHLTNLSSRYRAWVSDAANLRHLVLFETQSVRPGVRVVLADSADPGIAGAMAIPVDANHFNIATPESREGYVYRQVVRHVRTVLGELGEQGSDHSAIGTTDSAIRKSNEEVLAQLQRRVVTRAGVVQISGWDDLLAHARFDWRAQVRARLGQLREAGAAETAIAHLETDDLPLEVLAERLRAVDFAAIGRELGDQRTPSVQAALNWLRAEGSNPSFRTVIPISGSWGAGKSQLVLDLCKELVSDECCVLIMPDRNSTRPLVDRLAEAITKVTGASATDLRGFERWLVKRNRHAVVVLDDAHMDQNPAMAADLIADNTRAGRLTWAVTADSDRIDLLLGGDRSRTWRRHGLAAHTAGQSGWLDLDQVNLTERVGINVLRNWAPNASTADLDDLERNPEVVRAELLCEPWAAWLKVDTVTEPDGPLLDTDETFAQRLWDEYSDRLMQLGIERNLLDRVRHTLVDEFSSRYAGALDFASVITAIGDGAWARDDVRAALWAFVAADAVAKSTAEPGRRDEALLPEPAALWSRWLLDAGAIADDTGNEPASWRTAGAKGNWTAQLLLAEWLRLAVLPEINGTRPQPQRLVRGWLQDVQADKSPIWLALRSAPRRAHATVGPWITAVAPRAQNARECLLFLRLLQSCRNREWARGDRLRLLSDRWTLIGVWDLGAVALDVVRSLLDFETLAHQRATFRALERSELTHYGSELAEIIVQGYSARHPWDKFMAGLMAYLRSVDPRGAQGRSVQLSHTKRPVRVQEEPATWWQLLTSRALHELVRAEGTSAYELLRTWGWFADEYHPRVRLAMDQAAHSALGGVFRRGIAGQEETKRLIRRMVNGDRTSRASAVFVIKHTEVTKRQVHVRVDETLHPFLAELGRDQDLLARVKDLRLLLEANGIAAPRRGNGGVRPSRRRGR